MKKTVQIPPELLQTYRKAQLSHDYTKGVLDGAVQAGLDPTTPAARKLLADTITLAEVKDDQWEALHTLAAENGYVDPTAYPTVNKWLGTLTFDIPDQEVTSNAQ